MRKMSAENLVSSLSKKGMTFTSSTMVHEGNYSPSDADWNYKDIPHLNELHNQVEGLAAVIGEDIITNVFMQRLGPLRIPLTVVNYINDQDSQTYFTTFGPFCLVIHTQWAPIGLASTQVETTYNLGSVKWLRPCHRFVHKLLKNNYATLMATDIPMRERRGELRESGFSFVGDTTGYSFIGTLNTSLKNVIYPKTNNLFSASVAVSDLALGRTVLGVPVGIGFLIERTNEKILIFDRLCDHEGALLDESKIQKGCLRCPWHGKSISPLREFSTSEFQSAGTRLDIKFSNGKFNGQLFKD